MGQYFIIVNLDKKEYLHPHKLASGLKFWEILASNSATRVLAFLLRQSSEGGGGDYNEKTYEEDKRSFCGRWAGDKITIVGDYDDSQLFEKCQSVADMNQHNEWCLKEKHFDRMLTKDKLFKDITDKVLRQYNPFIEIEEYQVGLTSDGWRENKKKSDSKKACPDMIISNKGMSVDQKI